MTPTELATLQDAQDHEAAAVMAAETWEARALVDETEIGHLRHLYTVLERTALPHPWINGVPGDEPVPHVAMPSWALPEDVMRTSFDASAALAAAREWSERELDAFGDILAGRIGWDAKRGEWAELAEQEVAA